VAHEALGRPRGGGEGRGHNVSPRAQLVVRTAALLHSLTCRILSVLVTECEMFVRSQWLLCVYLRVRVCICECYNLKSCVRIGTKLSETEELIVFLQLYGSHNAGCYVLDF